MLSSEANRGLIPASQSLSTFTMTPLRQSVEFLCAALLGIAGTPVHLGAGGLPTQQQTQSAPKKQDASADSSANRMARGKKLVLKDGNFQVVRSYERNGERVRYFSLERGAWEEIPAAMVDWDATAKAEKADELASDELANKIHKQEAAQQMQQPIDVDASIQVAPTVFLPQGEGMFVLQDKSLKKIEQAGSQLKVDKKRVFEQVMSPIPIVPSKHHIELPGARATTRIQLRGTIEFYMRAVPTDADRDTAIIRSSRTGEVGPDLELVRATVKGNKRQLETIRSMMGQELSQDRTSIAIARWDVAPNVFRFTLSEPLTPGEYALAEILPNGMNLYVWDFGVDGPAGGKENEKSGKN
jgi:hypothetical protein